MLERARRTHAYSEQASIIVAQEYGNEWHVPQHAVDSRLEHVRRQNIEQVARLTILGRNQLDFLVQVSRSDVGYAASLAHCEYGRL